MLLCFFIFIYLAHILFDVILVKSIKSCTHFLKVYSPGNIMFVISRNLKAMEFPSSPPPSSWQWSEDTLDAAVSHSLHHSHPFVFIWSVWSLAYRRLCGQKNLLVTFSWLFYFRLFCSPFSENQPPPLSLLACFSFPNKWKTGTRKWFQCQV